ncbi:MAG: type II secretion system protein, partial [Nitrospira sp.]
TLIELLVVIAIIGILSAVVLASLNTARAKGSNAAVKSNLQGIRSQAEIIYDNTQDYTGICADQNIINAIDAAILAGSDTGATVATRCNASATEWAVNVKLKVQDSGNDWWCTDQTGIAKGEPAELGGATTCS